MKFAVKTFLGMGWRFFGEDLIESFEVDTLRAYLEGYGVSSESKILFNDPFMIGNDPDRNKIYGKFEESIIKKRRYYYLYEENDKWLEWTLSCLGYVIFSIIIPVKKQSRFLSISKDEGILMILNRYGLKQELLPALS